MKKLTIEIAFLTYKTGNPLNIEEETLGSFYLFITKIISKQDLATLLISFHKLKIFSLVER
jgi:hypothetical protein